MEKNLHNKNLLVELFVEELPPKALNMLGEAFAGVLFKSLKTQGLTLANAAVTAFATPRRLAAHISYVMDKAADKQISQKLMPASVGLDANGKATPALLKKLQSLGANESVVASLKNDNNILFLNALQAGVSLSDGLQKALDEALTKLPIPKVMTYQLADGWSSVNFVRPAHGLVAMHGSSVISISALGLQSSNTTHGHRFEAKGPTITINHADSYADQLKTDGAVIASFAERKAEIARQLAAAAAKQNLKPIDDNALLDEVTALVERPNVLLGQFEEVYLEVPQECLIVTMKANQKYFPLLDEKNKLTNKFLIVSNITPSDSSFVIGGNERVVRARLADAKFFFDQDRKKTLDNLSAKLYKVVYHNKLGSQGERMERVRTIATMLGSYLGGVELATQVGRAATICKSDLLTDMVGEFPELQGIMGRYYAQHEGMDNDVAYAIEDHYKPRFAGDELPRNKVGICLALGDKLETLAGLFSIGEKPTGDKDPFALRRHALGVIRLLIETKFPTVGLNYILQSIVIGGFRITHEQGKAAMDSLETFIFERLDSMLKELGYTSQEIDSVLVLRPQLLWEIYLRLAAVHKFAALPEAHSLAAANKRVGNILKKSKTAIEPKVSKNLLKEPAEKELASALASVKSKADAAFEEGDYTASLQALAALKTPVDDFFDNVMVNAEDVDLKNNRLALLNQLHQAMNRVADLSKLAS